MPKLVFFVGYHNSGKTTLIEKVSKKLTEMGYRVAYIKHDPKGHAFTDKKGSDTYRLFSILPKVAILSQDRLTLYERTEGEDIEEIVQRLFPNFDFVLLEGWKSKKGYKRISLSPELEGFPAYEKNLEEVIEYIFSEGEP
ncbi:molybdopterin-guanine dinucleotide biosynthesis protein B [Thermocrinis sp.]